MAAAGPTRPIASAITVFHTTDDPAFDAWLGELAASASVADGSAGTTRSLRDGELDLAFAAAFRSEQQLHAWLDSPDRSRVLDSGEAQGFRRKTSDLIVVEGSLPAAGISVFRHSVAAGKEAEFAQSQVGLYPTTAAFSGFEGTLVFPPDVTGRWLSMVRFRTGAHLDRWLTSRERAEALPELRANLTEDFSQIAHTTAFGSTMRIENGETKVTPNWKAAMIVLLVLYPTVMVLSRFLGPTLDRMGAEPWLALWLSQICSVGVMTYFLMPWVSKPFARWLDPIDGAGRRVSVLGAAVVIGVYIVTLALFASVKWLQFWDYDK